MGRNAFLVGSRGFLPDIFRSLSPPIRLLNTWLTGVKIAALISSIMDLHYSSFRRNAWSAGGGLSPPLAGYAACGRLVDSGRGHLIGLNLGRPLTYFCQELLHLGIRCTVVSFRIFLLVPQTDSQ